jgi:hypothetical protein
VLIGSEALRAELPAPAARFDAAERGLQVQEISVDSECPRVNAAGDVGGPVVVGRLDGAGEAVFAVVRDLDRVAVGLIGNHREHRPEDFFLRDSR